MFDIIGGIILLIILIYVVGSIYFSGMDKAIANEENRRKYEEWAQYQRQKAKEEDELRRLLIEYLKNK